MQRCQECAHWTRNQEDPARGAGVPYPGPLYGVCAMLDRATTVGLREAPEVVIDLGIGASSFDAFTRSTFYCGAFSPSDDPEARPDS